MQNALANLRPLRVPLTKVATIAQTACSLVRFAGDCLLNSSPTSSLPQRMPVRHSDGWRIEAPAKLNLGLRIFPRRPDGFHDIESWFVPLALTDSLTITEDPTLRISLTDAPADVDTSPQHNLVGRAAALLAQAGGIAPNCHIHLHKRIPTGGGLGGGSSDAAATLVALNQAWRLHLPTDDLRSLASQLGSDVPFFISSASAICRGRGELLTPLPRTNPLFAVLYLPPQGVATKAVYEQFDTMPPPAKNHVPFAAIANAGALEIAQHIQNDLAPAAYAVAPWLGELQQRLQQATGTPVHLSGSGSTLFSLFDHHEDALKLAATLTPKMQASCVIQCTTIINN